jgi:hypothetical protein
MLSSPFVDVDVACHHTPNTESSSHPIHPPAEAKASNRSQSEFLHLFQYHGNMDLDMSHDNDKK